MNKKLIITNAVILSLMISGCMQTANNPQTSAPASEAAVVLEKAPEVVQPKANDAVQILAKPEVPVLCYHRIAEGKKGDYTVSEATFEAHMKILADNGYHTISPAQLYDYLVYNHELPLNPVMITFDDSRSEHSEIAAPIMDKHGFKGVFFIMTITYNKKNYMTKDQIAALAKQGSTVGLHSWDHTMVTKYKDTTDWKKQVADPKTKLETIIGGPVEFWAYPNGVYDHKGAEELNKYFKLSFTLYSKRDSIYPLQTVRRIIAPECSPEGLMKMIRRTFGNELLASGKK